MLSLNIQLQFFSKLPPAVKPNSSTKTDGGKLRPVPAPSLYCLVFMLGLFETDYIMSLLKLVSLAFDKYV